VPPHGPPPARTLSLDGRDDQSILAQKISPSVIPDFGKIRDNICSNRATCIKFCIADFFVWRLYSAVLGKCGGIIQGGANDALDFGQAIDTHKGVTHLFGTREMAQIPAHVLAHLNKM